jgi:hypothetical protein
MAVILILRAPLGGGNNRGAPESFLIDSSHRTAMAKPSGRSTA